MCFVLMFVFVDCTGFVGASLGVCRCIVRSFFDRSPGLLGVTLYLLGYAFVGNLVVVGCFADRLLDLACYFIELSFDFAFSCCAHGPFSLLFDEALLSTACVMAGLRMLLGACMPAAAGGLEAAPSGDQVVDQYDHGEHQQDVNESATHV